MAMTRRQFMARAAGGAAGLALLPPAVGRAGAAFGQTAPDPATATRNRLVVIFLDGGNDGLNYVVPRADIAGAARYSVYRKVRPTLAYKPENSLLLDRPGDIDEALGFNAKLATLHRFYRDGRVAIVQGVDYPKHNYSHFASQDIWHSGEPERSPSSGWLGRHLDRAGAGDGELRGVSIGTKLPLMLQGRTRGAAAITSVSGTRFADGPGAASKARHAALAAFGAPRVGDPVRHSAGKLEAQTVSIVDRLYKAPAPPAGRSQVGNSLLAARVLLEQDLGVECVYVYQAGYDTHAGQLATHERLLSELDLALEAFWLGTANGAALGDLGPLPPAVATRTLVLIVSEFGRRIGEAGGTSVAGTDHGAAAPVVLIGPPPSSAARSTLVPGLHGDHPNLGTVLLPAKNLDMTTDVRGIYQAVLQSWLADPDPLYERIAAFPGLFAAPAPAPAPAAGKPSQGGKSVAASVGALSNGADADGPGGIAASLPSGGNDRALLDVARDGNGSHPLHPVTLGAALLFDAFVVALLIRSGQLRNIGATWRALRGDDASKTFEALPPAEEPASL